MDEEIEIVNELPQLTEAQKYKLFKKSLKPKTETNSKNVKSSAILNIGLGKQEVDFMEMSEMS